MIRRGEQIERAEGISRPTDRSPDARTLEAEAQIYNPTALMP